MITFMVNVLVLFSAQLAVGVLWYSFLMKGLLTKWTGDITVDPQATKEIVGEFYKWQLASNLAKAVFIALIVWLLPLSFGSYFVVMLFTLLIPAILISFHIRFGSRNIELIILESVQVIFSFLVMFFLAFIIKALMK